jgi:hypothetical protein
MAPTEDAPITPGRTQSAPFQLLSRFSLTSFLNLPVDSALVRVDHPNPACSALALLLGRSTSDEVQRSDAYSFTPSKRSKHWMDELD